MKDHVHARQGAGGVILLLAVDGNLGLGFIGGFEQQRAGSTGGIVNGGGSTGSGADANDFGHDAGDFSRRIELAFAFTALGGEVAHQVLVGVAKQVIAFGAVAAEIQAGVFEDGHQVGEALLHLLAATKFVSVVEIGGVDDAFEIVGGG